MKSRGPSTDPSPTPSSVHWLHTPCTGRRAGGQVVILLPLPIQSVDCKLNAYHEEQGPKYWYFSHSSFGPLIAKSMNMMKSRGPSTDPSPTPYSVCWLQTPCIERRAGGQEKSMNMMKSRGPSTDPSLTPYSVRWLQTPMMKNMGPSTDTSSTPSLVCWFQSQCIWWRVGDKVLILHPLIFQNVDCKLHAYDEQRRPVRYGQKTQKNANSSTAVSGQNVVKHIQIQTTHLYLYERFRILLVEYL